MVGFSRRTRSAGDEKASAFRGFLTQIQPYQNIIFFVLLIISLAILLILWRGYRVRKLTENAWGVLNKVGSVQDLRNMEQRFGSTQVLPFIRYRLGNAYYQARQYQAAKKEYERFLKDYPKHCLRPRVESRLKETETNIKWQSGGELKKRLKELKDRRNFPLVTIKIEYHVGYPTVAKRGEFQVDLYEEDAPNTVANFINLAEKGAYDQMPFNETTPNLGLCLGLKDEPLTYTIPFETNSLKNIAGTVGMIRDLDPEVKEGKPPDIHRDEPLAQEHEEFLNSASSRFYISLMNNPAIDGKYTVFGRVSKGMDVVRRLKKGDKITKIIINRKRAHPYEPEVIEMK